MTYTPPVITPDDPHKHAKLTGYLSSEIVCAAIRFQSTLRFFPR